MSGYNPEFDLPRLRGEEAERYVRALRDAIGTADGAAMGVGPIEVKRDDRASATGNAYFEYECLSRRDGEYHPSGIARTGANTWAHYMDGVVVLTPTWVLKKVIKQHGTKRECTYGGNPTRGLTVPLSVWLPATVAAMNEPITRAA